MLRYEVCPIFINEKMRLISMRRYGIAKNEKMWNCKE